MATATARTSLGVSANAVDNTQKTLIIRGSVFVSAAADTYTTGGITMTLSNLGDNIKSSGNPNNVDVFSSPGTPGTNLFLYSYLRGTTLDNGKLQVWTGAAAQTGLTELANGAAMTNVFADEIHFTAYFPRV